MKTNLKNTILALAAFAMVGGVTAAGVTAFGNDALVARAEDELVTAYTLDGTKTGGSSGYAEASTITQNSVGWKAVGNTTMNPWRIGGKNISKVDREIYSTTAISGKIKQVAVTSGSATATVHSLTISVYEAASDAESGSNALATRTVTSGIVSSTVTLNNESGYWEDCFYRIVYNVTAGSSNQFVQFSQATFSALKESSAVPTEITLLAEDAITSGVKGSVTTEIEYEVSYEGVEGTQEVTFASGDESVAVIDSVDTTNKVATVRFLDNAPKGVKITCTSDEDNSISASHTFTVTGLTEPTAVTDVITLSDTGVSGTSYADITEFTKSGSTAKYGGQCAGGNSSIQLRSNNSNSGIVITSAGKVAKSVSVVWNSATEAGRTLDIYGKNTPYTAATGLYSSSTQGTKLGSIVKGTSTSLTLTGNYHYLGLRSYSGAMYLTSISIVWEQETAASFAGFLNDFESSSSYDCKDFYSEVTKVWDNVTDKSEFTAENYADAYARCVAYATANGQKFDNTSGFHKAMAVNFGANKDSSVFLLAALATIGLVSVGGMILLAKKRKKA